MTFITQLAAILSVCYGLWWFAKNFLTSDDVPVVIMALNIIGVVAWAFYYFAAH